MAFRLPGRFMRASAFAIFATTASVSQAAPLTLSSGVAADDGTVFGQIFGQAWRNDQAWRGDREWRRAPDGVDPDHAPLPVHLRRQLVDYPPGRPPGTIVIDTDHTYLYLIVGGGRALRYGIGVGREGFTWSGTETITRMAAWPDWHPPAEMIRRQPYLPRFVAGGPGNPLGARALYLGQSQYRIHGTNDPSTIGRRVSSGCIRLTNADISDLYGRVRLGATVIVLPRSRSAERPALPTTRPAARFDTNFTASQAAPPSSLY